MSVVLVILVLDDFIFITTNTTAYVAIFSLGLTGGAVIILGFVFIPKVLFAHSCF